MATDRQGATIAVGDVYMLAGKVVRIEGTRILVRDAAGKLRHVEADDVVKVDATVSGGGGGGHDPVTVTDTASINLTLTGQDIQASAIFGSGSGQVCQGNDARLSDARTPSAHTHAASDITSGLAAVATSGSASDIGTGTLSPDRFSAHADLVAEAKIGTGAAQVAAGDHTHAQLHDAVTVSDTSSIDLTLTGQAISAAAIFGSTSGTVCQGNDARLSDARTPTAHVHAGADITSGTVAAARLPAATTTTLGVVELATDGESASGVVVQGNDARLSNARTPTPHDHVIGDVTDLQSELDAINFALVGKAATSHTHASTDIVSVTTDRLIGRDTAGTGAAEQLTVGGGVEFTGSGGIQRGALTGAVTASAGSGTTAFGSFKANAILMNMTTSSGVPTAVDGVDAASNLLAYLGGSFIVPAWSQSTLALGGLAI